MFYAFVLLDCMQIHDVMILLERFNFLSHQEDHKILQKGSYCGGG
jgi:hypothetical protein